VSAQASNHPAERSGELRAYLSNPGLRRPLAEARRALERHGRELRGSVRIARLSMDEARELSGLLGRRRPFRRGESCAVELSRLDEALRTGTRWRVSLLEAVELAHDRPLADEPARKASELAAVDAVWHNALEHELCRRDERVAGWIDSLRATGALARALPTLRERPLSERLEVQTALLRDSLAVLAALRERSGRRDPPMARALIADELFGDPHALDDGRALERLVTGALAFLAGVPRPAGAIDRRELWRHAGVSLDALSASVLALGLRPAPDSPYARSCLERTLAGTPDLLTLHGLQRHPLRFPGVAIVFSCENRTVIEAAAGALAAQAPPLVCTSGWPNSAVCLLFEMLIAGGAEIRHHGDFEWGGVRIAAWLRARLGALRWRYDALSYEATASANEVPGKHLAGRPPATSVDPDLIPAMRVRGRAVHEEAVLDQLLDDLARAAVR
jgi:uncharacterized protein (TIGR02679 family)